VVEDVVEVGKYSIFYWWRTVFNHGVWHSITSSLGNWIRGRGKNGKRICQSL